MTRKVGRVMAHGPVYWATRPFISIHEMTFYASFVSTMKSEVHVGPEDSAHFLVAAQGD